MSTMSVDDNTARIARLLMAQQDAKLFGTVTVIYQNGVPERVEVKTGKRVADLK